MFQWKKAVLAGMAAALFAQEEEGGGRRRRDPAQMRQRMMERMKESLGATDEEWAVISPRLEKVMTSRTAAMARRVGRRGAGEEVELTPVQQAAQELQTVLDDQASTAEQVVAKLTAYREAREKARQELAVAEEELREVLSAKQEARMVLTGMLD